MVKRNKNIRDKTTIIIINPPDYGSSKISSLSLFEFPVFLSSIIISNYYTSVN
jgi:hypothetical protein